MKTDWLSLLLRAKSHCRKIDANVDEVISVFTPLLAAAFKQDSDNPAKLLTAALFSSLSDGRVHKEMDARADSELKALEELVPFPKVKSGALDKLNDNCMQVVLSFLDYKSRCNGAELSCHRLFAISRLTTIHVQTLTKQLYDCSDEYSVFRRIVPQKLGFFSSAVKLHLAKELRNCLKHFDFDARSDSPQLLEFHFPELVSASFSNPTVDLMQDVVNRHPKVTNLSLVQYTGIHEQKLHALSQLTQVRKLKIGGSPLKQVTGCNWNHIRDLTLEGSALSVFSGLLHIQLENLTLHSCYGTFDGMELLPSLKRLTITCGNEREYFNPVAALRTVNAPNIESVSVTSMPSEMDACVEAMSNSIANIQLLPQCGRRQIHDFNQELAENLSEACSAKEETVILLRTDGFATRQKEEQRTFVRWFAAATDMLPSVNLDTSGLDPRLCQEEEFVELIDL